MDYVRIMAHYMHEAERDFALEKLDNEQLTDAYVIGDIAKDDIPLLEEKGPIVEQLGDPWDDYAPVAVPAEPFPTPADPTIEYFLITLRGPMLEEQEKYFEYLGIQSTERLPGNVLLAGLNAVQLEALEDLPFISAINVYGATDTESPTSKAVRADAVQGTTRGDEAHLWDLLLHNPQDKPALVTWLNANASVATIVDEGKRKIRIAMDDDSPFYDELLQRLEIARVEAYIPPILFSDVARTIIGVANHFIGANEHLTGTGQIIAVADTGLDDTHRDFQGRVAGTEAIGRPGRTDDPHGHGTHVAGTALGTGTASAGTLAGVAPGASLYFQSLLDIHGGLKLPIDLGDLFESAYNAGARIHNNSWGADVKSVYTIDATEVDAAVDTHRDLLVVIAAGNDGDGAVQKNALKGFVEWLSINSPASSKNALTVGASRSNRLTGGYSQKTYGQQWGHKFPHAPISGQTVSGDPEGIAAFSSRGPIDDYRIKPDVVAPGTDILAARALNAPTKNFWGEYAANGVYAYMGGTSMATPVVSGYAALVREYYEVVRTHRPSAALVKATIINGARWLTGKDATADPPGFPNYHQGFGMVYLPWTLPHIDEPNLKLVFEDSWNQPIRQLRTTGQRRRFRVTVGNNQRLRICMAYTDIPGRAIQNDLNLFVEHEATGKKWIGNEQMHKGWQGPDSANNVEVVRIDDAPAGDYLIQISARNLLKSPQDFALVVTGNLTSDLTNA